MRRTAEEAYRTLDNARIGIFGTHVEEPLKVLRAAGFSNPSDWLRNLQEKGWVRVIRRGQRNSPKVIQLIRKVPRESTIKQGAPLGTVILVDWHNLYHALKEIGVGGVPIPEILAEGENLIASFMFVNDLTPLPRIVSFEEMGFTVVLSPRRKDGHDRCDAHLIKIGKLLLTLPEVEKVIIASGDADLAPLAEAAKRTGKVLTVFSATKIGPALKEFADEAVEIIHDIVAPGALEYRRILEELMWMDQVIAQRTYGEELDFIKAVTKEAVQIIKKEELTFFVILDMLWANPDLRLWRKKKGKLAFRKLLTALRDIGFIGYTETRKRAYLNKQHRSYRLLYDVLVK